MRSTLGLTLAATLALAIVGAQAQDDVVFLYPSEEGLSFFQRDAVTVSYVSDIEDPSLWTFCSENDEVVFKGRIDHAAPKNGSQEVRINFSTDADTCWFNLRDNGNEELGWNSVQFSLSSDERSQTTLGLGQETAAETTGAPSTSETSSSTSETPASETTSGGGSSNQDNNDDEESSSSSGLSTGAKAGIGAGVGVGVLGIAAFAGVFFLLRRRKANEPSHEYETPELQSTTVVENKTNWGGPPPPAVETTSPQEMSAGYEPERRAGAYEMPA